MKKILMNAGALSGGLWALLMLAGVSIGAGMYLFNSKFRAAVNGLFSGFGTVFSVVGTGASEAGAALKEVVDTGSNAVESATRPALDAIKGGLWTYYMFPNTYNRLNAMHTAALGGPLSAADKQALSMYVKNTEVNKQTTKPFDASTVAGEWVNDNGLTDAANGELVQILSLEAARSAQSFNLSDDDRARLNAQFVPEWLQ